ncbi:tRNA nucleotidyltransferase [Aeromonas phage vB_AspA_Bolek]|nr:tRNA nucleotidyltransferase [Aeromonas phage vB_AspA_Bolek]
MKVPVKVHPHNTTLLNVGMQVVALLSESAVYCGFHACSNIVGGLPRDMHFGVEAKDVDIVVYGRQDWAMLNDHDEYFDIVEDNLYYMFGGDVVNMTDDDSGAASSQPDNGRVYRVYACDQGKVNIIYYQDCYSVDEVIAKFDNTINAFWIDTVGTAFNGLYYEGDEVTAVANPARVTTPERDQRMRDKAAMFGLHYQDPTEVPVRATGMSPACAAPYGDGIRPVGIDLHVKSHHPVFEVTDDMLPFKG